MSASALAAPANHSDSGTEVPKQTSSHDGEKGAGERDIQPENGDLSVAVVQCADVPVAEKQTAERVKLDDNDNRKCCSLQWYLCALFSCPKPNSWDAGKMWLILARSIWTVRDGIMPHLNVKLAALKEGNPLPCQGSWSAGKKSAEKVLDAVHEWDHSKI